MTVATLACAGDVMINRPDPGSMLRQVEAYFQQADIGYCNLEGPTCGGGEKHPGKAGISLHLQSSPQTASALTRAGIDVVSLANNHALDYGVTGLDQTIKALDGAGIAHAGAGRDLAAARQPAFLEVNGLRIALLSYTSVCVPPFAATATTPGVAMVRIKTTYAANLRLFQQPGSPMLTRTTGEPEDVAMLLDDVKAAKTGADVVIVAWHWGISERWGKLADYQKELGRAVIDAGAAAILGHHAHMLLGVEFYRGCPIFYSLGNFAFDMDHSYFRRESAIVLCNVSREGVSNVRVVPVLIDDRHEPVPARADGDGQKVVWFLEHLSEDLNTKFANRGDHVELAARS
ncbi:MAG: CapA family protein [Betaproteobacteria bacterium]|nr:CapA family protein [Betaproteobacteria bacterium]